MFSVSQVFPLYDDKKDTVNNLSWMLMNFQEIIVETQLLLLRLLSFTAILIRR